MQLTREPLEVVGAVILNEEAEVLCALRSSEMSLPGVWEFPGGKIDPGESPESALAREIEEELGCRIEVGDLVADCTHAYPTVTVRLRTYQARVLNGSMQANEHEKLAWYSVPHLPSLTWAPADIPTIEELTRRWKEVSGE